MRREKAEAEAELGVYFAGKTWMNLALNFSAYVGAPHCSFFCNFFPRRAPCGGHPLEQMLGLVGGGLQSTAKGVHSVPCLNGQMSQSHSPAHS